MSEAIKDNSGVEVKIKVKVDTTEAEEAVEKLSGIFDKLLEKGNRLLTVLEDTEKTIGSEWISVKDRLPEKTRAYLVNHSSEKYSISNYSARHKMFGAFDCYDSTECADTDVTHWMELPEPPTK